MKSVICLLAILVPTLNGMLIKSIPWSRSISNIGCKHFCCIFRRGANNVLKKSVITSVNDKELTLDEKYKRISELKSQKKYFPDEGKKEGIFWEV